MSVRPTITPERWDRVQQIFHQALEREDIHRGSFVEEACGDDVELRGAVASLIEAHERGGIVAPLEGEGLMPYGAGHLAQVKAALADRYTIERPLGAGGMATVYLAEDLRHGRKVAIKVLHPGFAATLGVERFLREIKIAATLRASLCGTGWRATVSYPSMRRLTSCGKCWTRWTMPMVRA
jgi:serine/threonine-protein kinase